MKQIITYSILSLLFIHNVHADDNIVKITKDIPYVNVIDSGTKIKIERIQDTQNRLTDDYAKTSRQCPPHCLAPIRPLPDIKNIAELELLSFMQEEVAKDTGVIADAREPEFYVIETIPTAINIPFGLVEFADKNKFDKLFQILGAKINPDGTRDYTKAKKIVAFCSGPWCLASPKLLTKIAQAGYPHEKLFYYRPGLQGWKLLGLTTTVRQENTK